MWFYKKPEDRQSLHYCKRVFQEQEQGQEQKAGAGCRCRQQVQEQTAGASYKTKIIEFQPTNCRDKACLVFTVERIPS